MKLIPLAISSTLIGIVGFASYLFIHLGAYKNVELVGQDLGPYKIVFSHHIGPYHKILESIEQVEKWAKENQVGCDLSFGEFLDDPEVVVEDRLQSNGGCIVASQPTNLPSHLNYREIPRKYYLTAEFDGAPSIGPLKVYPKAMKWIQTNHYVLGGPVIEIYSMTSGDPTHAGTASASVHTRYLFPLGKP